MSEIPELTDVERWAYAWLPEIANGSNTVSQRKLTSVEKRGGRIETARRVAMAKGMHSLLLEDDKGGHLVATSTKPSAVVC